MKLGDDAHHASQVIDLWKGMYNDEVVALKILRVPQDGPQVPRVKSVSMFRNSHAGVCSPLS